jgi:hypothetical protein
VDLEEEVLPEEASDQEKKVDSEAIEILLQERNVQTDQEEKADLIATVLQKKHQVLFKEKAVHQDVQKVRLINQQVVHLRLLKAEGRGSSSQFQFVYPEKEIIITPFFTNVIDGVFFEILSFYF